MLNGSNTKTIIALCFKSLTIFNYYFFIVAFLLIPEYSLSTRIGIFEESDEPPPGFEAVDVAEETNYVEAYFFGNLLGSSLMTYQDNKVVIKNPGLLVKKMKGLKDPEAVLKALTGEIAGNSELACSNENARQPCGILSPKVAAVIYDRFKRELSIFVNADLLDKKELEFDQLPRSTSNFSFLNNVFVNSTGSKRERNYTVNNRNVFAYKEAFIDIDSSYFLDEGDTSLSTVGEKRFRFSTITGNLNRWNKTFQIGTVRNEGSNFLSSQLLIGGKFFTTLNQLTDLNSAQSTPIEVFLALPGEVQVFRDKKLLYAQNYTAGNQFINTSSFPAGNYDVQIKIIDINGNVTETTQAFVKTEVIPPFDYPFYYGSFGFIENTANRTQELFPQFFNDLVGQMGTAVRVANSWALAENVQLARSVAASESSVIFVDSDITLKVGGLITTKKNYGYFSDLRYRASFFSGGGNFLSMFGPTKAQRNKIASEFDPVSGTRVRYSAFLNLPLYKGNFLFNTSYGKSDVGTKNRAYTATFSYPLYRESGIFANWLTSYNVRNNDRLYIFGINVSFSHDNWRHAFRGTYNREQDIENQLSERDTQDYTLSSAWTKSESGRYDLGAGVTGSHTSASDSLRPSVSYSDNFGRFQSSASYSKPISGAISRQFSFSGDTSFIAAEEKSGFSNSSRNTTGIFVDVISSEADQEFEVLINNRPAQVIKSGTAAFIQLSPFKTYMVSINSLAGNLYTYNPEPKFVTLYESNIQPLSWEVQKVFLLISQFVRPDGSFVQYAGVEGGVDLAQTDENGYIQVEIPEGTEKLFVEPIEGAFCEVKVGGLAPEDNYVYKESIVCVPTKKRPKRIDNKRENKYEGEVLFEELKKDETSEGKIEGDIPVVTEEEIQSPSQKQPDHLNAIDPGKTSFEEESMEGVQDQKEMAEESIQEEVGAGVSSQENIQPEDNIEDLDGISSKSKPVIEESVHREIPMIDIDKNINKTTENKKATRFSKELVYQEGKPAISPKRAKPMNKKFKKELVHQEGKSEGAEKKGTSTNKNFEKELVHQEGKLVDLVKQGKASGRQSEKELVYQVRDSSVNRASGQAVNPTRVTKSVKRLKELVYHEVIPAVEKAMNKKSTQRPEVGPTKNKVYGENSLLGIVPKEKAKKGIKTGPIPKKAVYYEKGHPESLGEKTPSSNRKELVYREVSFLER